jgi:hypothetical protein
MSDYRVGARIAQLDVPGTEYWHTTQGRVMLVATHPHDGATVIIERQETTDPDDDDHVFDTCERSDLWNLTPQGQWPYLGFTSRERAAESSRAFGREHGFAEVPEGSGLWQYPDGTVVPHSVWRDAWNKTYLPEKP